MKKTIMSLVVVLFMLVVCGTSHAKEISLDLAGSYATEPAGNFGSTVGFGVGGDFGWTLFSKSSGKKADNYLKNIKFRADIHYYKWDDSMFGVDVKYTRIPLFLGGRYFFPVAGMNKAGWEVFGEAGIEVSRDELEVAVPAIGPFPASKASEKETNTGVSIGGGIRYNFTDKFFGGISGRHHFISDPYTTLNVLIGFYIK